MLHQSSISQLKNVESTKAATPPPGADISNFWQRVQKVKQSNQLVTSELSPEWGGMFPALSTSSSHL
jgi:hypothetical protein